MARPSNRETRRRDLVLALERVLARSGLADTTVAAVADEAGVTPGLVHHHFEDKEELFAELTRSLYGRFRSASGDGDLQESLRAALAIRGSSGIRAARAWVGLFAEAPRSPGVQTQVERALRSELRRMDRSLMEAGLPRARAEEVAAGLLSFVLGSLVFGALLPRTRTGFAAGIASEIAAGLIAPDEDATPPSHGR